jgi:hypothetical protein
MMPRRVTLEIDIVASVALRDDFTEFVVDF